MAPQAERACCCKPSCLVRSEIHRDTALLNGAANRRRRRRSGMGGGGGPPDAEAADDGSSSDGSLPSWDDGSPDICCTACGEWTRLTVNEGKCFDCWFAVPGNLESFEESVRVSATLHVHEAYEDAVKDGDLFWDPQLDRCVEDRENDERAERENVDVEDIAASVGELLPPLEDPWGDSIEVCAAEDCGRKFHRRFGSGGGSARDA